MIDALGQETNHRWKPHPSGGYSAKLGGFYQMQCLVCAFSYDLTVA